MEATHPEAVTVEIAGQERTLRLSMSAFRLAQLRHGTTVTLEDLASVDLTLIPRLIWIARLPGEPALTEEECLLELAHDEAAEEAATVAVLESLGRVTALLTRVGQTNGHEGKAGSP